MKPDSERTVRYKSSLNKRRDFLHVHVGKELAKKLSKKKRSLMVRKGDEVRVMRGSAKGRSGKVVRVSHDRAKVYVEGIVRRNARGREIPAALEPSNLVLIGIEATPERSDVFKGEAKKAEPQKKEHISAGAAVAVDRK